ncbi:hypothetical protein [Longispora albida]|uniref:hypothetical protein n=1 Tax=Longispora albida TaxID=203523 RepID=UPI0003766DD1|nr:hypothetical protein [Longispora albida]
MRTTLLRLARPAGVLIFTLLAGLGLAVAPASAAPGHAVQSVTLDQTGGYAGVRLRYTVDRNAATAQASELLSLTSTPAFTTLGDSYLPDDPCCDRFTYDLTVRYKNGVVKTVSTIDGGGAPAILEQAISLAKDAGTVTDLATAGPTLLFVELRPGQGAQPVQWTISCATGETCASLTPSAYAALAPVPAGAACTRIYGGPQTAWLFGLWQGEWVSASFSRADGCQLSRWERAASLLTPPA